MDGRFLKCGLNEIRSFQIVTELLRSPDTLLVNDSSDKYYRNFHVSFELHQENTFTKPSYMKKNTNKFLLSMKKAAFIEQIFMIFLTYLCAVDVWANDSWVILVMK